MTRLSRYALIVAVCTVLSFQMVTAQDRTPTEPSPIDPCAVIDATATELALAMGVPAAFLASASLETSDPMGAGVGTAPLGDFFPTDGGTFTILATGLAATAESPNDSESTSGILGGLNNGEVPCDPGGGGGCDPATGNDLVQLTLRLTPPSTATCLAFDIAFYSEEFPEFVLSQFNDAFTAEIGGTDLSIVNSQVVAPNNFAFDTADNLLSINTVFGMTANTGTTYDGATALLRAVTPLEPVLFVCSAASTNAGTECAVAADCMGGGVCARAVEVVLSIQDLGDSIYDSAVFLDNFDWLFDPNCAQGLFVDSDGDALLDVWETDGIDVDGNGTIDLDLPAMGADPMHKDVFIETDYMVLPPKGCSTGSTNAGVRCQVDGDCAGGTCDANADPHSHKPNLNALNTIVQAFANAPVANPDGMDGIRLHIDGGADTVMNPVTGDLWGAGTQSEELVHQSNLGTASAPTGFACPNTCVYSWDDFDVVKGVGATPGKFSVFRRDVFHYAIFAHDLAPEMGGTSGISRGILASDFLVSLGSWTNMVGTVNQQAGTLMHEFGHNLDLLHGGTDSVNDKPNYLSVMNYSFQTRGLRIGGVDANFDFSIADLPDLDETSLDESVGLNGGAPIAGYGTRFSCITPLSAAAAASATTISVADAAIFPANPFPSLRAEINGREKITWTGKAGNTLTGVLGCVPELPCTTATPGLREAHAVGETVSIQEGVVNNANGAIDWNCDGVDDDMAATDINNTGVQTTLESFNDWANVAFDGGAVGKLGQIVELPDTTDVQELDKETDEKNATPFAVSVMGPSDMDAIVGASKTHVFEVKNEGDEADTYTLDASSVPGWADLSTVPTQVSLDSGEKATVSIVVTVPADTLEGVQDVLTLGATSIANAKLMDSATSLTTAFAPSIEELIEVVEKLGLPNGLTNSLTAKLNAALNQGSTQNQLQAFINQVQAQSGKKIPSEVAGELIAAAELLLALPDGGGALNIQGQAQGLQDGSSLTQIYSGESDGSSQELNSDRVSVSARSRQQRAAMRSSRSREVGTDLSSSATDEELRERSRDGLIEMLATEGEASTRLRVARELLDRADPSIDGLLQQSLQAIRADAIASGESAVAEEAKRLIRSMNRSSK